MTGFLLGLAGFLVIAAGFAIDRSRDYDMPWSFVVATASVASLFYGAGFATLVAS